MGGYIAGHDIEISGVNMAVSEFFKDKYSTIGSCNCCWIAQKEIT
jgi:hypothetical protein